MSTVELVEVQGQEEARVAAAGILDYSASRAFQACLEEAVNTGAQRVVVEFAGVVFLGASCRRILVAEGMIMKSRGRELVLRDVPPAVKRVIRSHLVARIVHVEL